MGQLLPLRFTFEITPEQVREATAGVFWRQLRQPRLLASLAGLWVLAQAMLWMALPRVGWAPHALLGLLLPFSAWCLAVLASRHYQGLALRNFGRIQGQAVAVSLDEDAYRFEAAWGRGAIPWQRFDSLWRFEGVWVLLEHSPGGASVLLPAASLDEEARMFILGKLGPKPRGGASR